MPFRKKKKGALSGACPHASWLLVSTRVGTSRCAQPATSKGALSGVWYDVTAESGSRVADTIFVVQREGSETLHVNSYGLYMGRPTYVVMANREGDEAPRVIVRPRASMPP